MNIHCKTEQVYKLYQKVITTKGRGSEVPIMAVDDVTIEKGTEATISLGAEIEVEP